MEKIPPGNKLCKHTTAFLRQDKEDQRRWEGKFHIAGFSSDSGVGPQGQSNDFNEEDLFVIEIRFLFYLAATSRIL